MDQLKNKLDQLKNKREQPEEGMSRKERMKSIFKKYLPAVAAFTLYVGTTIGAIVGILSVMLSSVASGVGNTLKTLGKKLGQALPGALGAIASLVFKAAGEAFTFLAKNAWILILAVAAFLLNRFKSRN